MAITISDHRHGGSSSPGYGTAQSWLRGEVVAPVRSMAAPIGNATDLSQRKRHEFRNLASTQRYEPQNTDTVAEVNAATTYFGDTHATHTPGHAGRALPYSDRHPAPIAFDAYQNIDGAEGAAGSAGGVAERGDRPRETAALRQRSQSLTDTARILRDQRRRDMIAAIEEYRRASGPDRVWWRGHASWLIGQWRCLRQEPEMRAFRAAVARSQGARP